MASKISSSLAGKTTRAAPVTTTPKKKELTTAQLASQKGIFTNKATGIQTDSRGNPINSQYSYSGETGTFVNSKTGEIVKANTKSPIATNQNYKAVKSGTGTVGVTNQGMPTLGNSPGVYGNTPGMDTSGGYNLLGTNALGMSGGTNAGVSGASDSTSVGDTPAGTSAYFNNPYSSTGSYNTSFLGGTSTVPGQTSTLGAMSQNGTLTPEQIAQQQYNSSVFGANQDATLAQQNYEGTVGLAGQQTQQGLQLLGTQAQTAFDQAQRNEDYSLESNAIEKQKADLEYNTAVQQIAQNRDSENQYLMQKLAGAGALDSTAGVQILGKSAENYDKMFANLSGQRQIALAEFAQADSAVRNQFATTIENVTNQVAQLQTQLMQSFQQTALSANQTRAGALSQSSKDKQTAYSNFLSSLYDIQVAKQQAQADALAAAQKQQQQAFDNAISIAGLTGTFTDPLTGKETRTLNGMKYDDSLKPKAGAGGSNITPAVYTTLLQQAASLGIIDQAQYTGLAGETNKTAIEQYGALLQSQISQVQTQHAATALGADSVLGTGKSGAGYAGGGFPYSAGNASTTTYTRDADGNVVSSDTFSKVPFTHNSGSSTPSKSSSSKSTFKGNFLSFF